MSRKAVETKKPEQRHARKINKAWDILKDNYPWSDNKQKYADEIEFIQNTYPTFLETVSAADLVIAMNLILIAEQEAR